MTERSLPARFAAVRATAPTAVAVSCDGVELTYAELDEVSADLALRLVRRGVAVGSPVGLVVRRSVATAVGVLGILRAGAAYVPLDPGYPEERLRMMVADAGVEVVVGETEVAERFGLASSQVETTVVSGAAATASGIPRERRAPSRQGRSGDRAGADSQVAAGVRVETEAGWLSSSPDPVPSDPPSSALPGVPPALPVPGPDDPAYVIYTSGSTGRPKGCVVTHGNVLALLDAALPLFRVGPGDRWSLFHSISFDFSVWELWGALAGGGTSVIVPEAAAVSPEAFAAFLGRERISVLNQVPSVFRSVAAAHRQAGSPALAVRYLVFGGEAVDLDVVRGFLATVPEADRPTVVNMYGITETTVHATFKELGPEDLAGAVRSPIGRALGHLEIELWEEAGGGDAAEAGGGPGARTAAGPAPVGASRVAAVAGAPVAPVAPGECGEMWLTGAGVAAGYLNRPELTAERFVTVGGRRYYRSGDLARRLPDGGLEYLGRADQQVKLRGFRIELGEIEAVLRSVPGVREAAAGVVTTAAGARILVGYVVGERDGGTSQVPDTRTLKAAVALVLPAHMVPARFVTVAELPLTASGKLDRAALAGLAADRSSPGP